MRTERGPRRQRGAALLMMMLVVLVTATAALVTRLDLDDARMRQQVDAGDVLARARQALLDYAMVHPDMNPGDAAKLPCPDIDAGGGYAEGEAHAGDCGATGETVIGRLPWRTLGIEPLRDASGACLWYVVSGSHKHASVASAAMINDDTSGQLQLYGIETAGVIAGAQPAERPVAMVLAPMRALSGQTRAAPAAGAQCSSSFAAADFLDVDAGSGISNAVLSGAADTVDVLGVTAGFDVAHNDRIATVSPADLERVITARHDYLGTMRALGLAVADCIADYAANNPGGGNDRRMPWPAPLQLGDYRPDANYDDTAAGALSGRLADVVDDSNTATGNGIARVLSDCDAVAVPAWTPQMLQRWRHWKDHFFYAVAESYAPTAAVPSSCASCLTVNGAGQYAAVILFSNRRLPALSQVRDAPPIDADTRDDPGNYLEAGNAAWVPYSSGAADFTSQPATATFNDLLFCVDAALAVTEC